jgi:hypothetical protein
VSRAGIICVSGTDLDWSLVEEGWIESSRHSSRKFSEILSLNTWVKVLP